MLEIKILCNCGAKYKFDVEPLNGRLPGPVRCPVCSADGTEAGNRLIGEKLGGPSSPVSAVVAIPVVSMQQPILPNAPTSHAAPTPAIRAVGPASAPAAASAPSTPARPPSLPSAQAVHPVLPTAPQKLDVPKPAANPLVPKPNAAGAVRLGITGQPEAPVQQTAPTAAPLPAVPRTMPKGGAGSTGISVKRGYLGAAIGGVIALIPWLGLVLVFRGMSIVAWGLGALIGWMAQSMARGTDAKVGIAAAVSATCVIVGGLLLGFVFTPDGPRLSLFTILWVFFGVGTAYRVAAGK
jgi:hypothetical protein